MEPTDLKNDPPADAQLEAWLRSGAASAPLPDDGFTRRVLAALPPPRATSHRLMFCLAGASVGAAVALLNGRDWPGFATGFATGVQSLATAFGPLDDLRVGCALVLALASVLFAFWRETRQRLGV